jgi:hypothetical protein
VRGRQHRIGAADLVARDDDDGVDLAAEEELDPTPFHVQVLPGGEDQDIGRGSFERGGQMLGER